MATSKQAVDMCYRSMKASGTVGMDRLSAAFKREQQKVLNDVMSTNQDRDVQRRITHLDKQYAH